MVSGEGRRRACPCCQCQWTYVRGRSFRWIFSKTKVSGGLAPEPLTDDSSGSLAMLAAMRRASSLVSTRVTPCRIRRHDRRCLF